MLSLIVTTYNNPLTLKLVLRSLEQQKARNFEVIVADDGSGEETAAIIKQYISNTVFTLKHIWQEDRGFRAAEIRNKAVAQSTGDYLIFLDGDCIPFTDFIEQHKRLAEQGFFVRGSRVMMSQAFTAEMLQQSLPVYLWTAADCLVNRVQGRIKRILPLLHIPFAALRKQKKKKWYGVKTCNLGVWRSDFMRVNGFDENFVGWGHEDADLAVRLIRAGVFRKEGSYAVTVLHSWHPLHDRSQESNNMERLKKSLNSTIIAAENGLAGHLH